MTNDEARAYFVSKGLTYSSITENMFTRLQELLSNELEIYRTSGGKHAEEMNLKLRKPLKKQIKILKRTGLQFAYLRVDGSYFHNREAISFNRDGFIGFGGEFSSANTQPMLMAFCKWCDEIAKIVYV